MFKVLQVFLENIKQTLYADDNANNINRKKYPNLFPVRKKNVHFIENQIIEKDKKSHSWNQKFIFKVY